jgi:hypothetical protein
MLPRQLANLPSLRVLVELFPPEHHPLYSFSAASDFFEIEEAAGALAITPLNSPSGIWFQIKRSANPPTRSAPARHAAPRHLNKSALYHRPPRNFCGGKPLWS